MLFNALQGVPLRHHDTLTNGVRLHVVEAGPADGDPVLFLHGFPEFWYGWHRQIPAFARAGYRVIVPDQRGYHRSEKPPDVDAYRLPELVEDAHGLIDATGREAINVVGHDWGAAVAWELAARHPDRVRRLGILNVPHPRVMHETVWSDLRQAARSWYALFFQLPVLPEQLLGAGNARGLSQLMRRSSRPNTFSGDDLAIYRHAWQQPGAIRGMLHWYRAALRNHALRTVPADPIEPPTLIIWGRKDVALLPEMAQKSANRCRDGRLVMIDDATHWVQHDAAERVNTLLLDFLGDA